MRYAGEALKKDGEFMLEAIKQNRDALEYADESLQNDREFILEVVKQKGKALEYANEIFKKDREIVMEAVKQKGCALYYANEIFKKDREIVLEAVKHEYVLILYYTDVSLRTDREFILEAVKQNGKALGYADESFKNDGDIVFEAVKQKGKALKYANEILKKDREIVMEAVKQNGRALKYANELFKKDREIVMEAVKQNGRAFEYTDESMKKDREIVLQVFKQNRDVFLNVNESLQKDREFVLAAVKQDGQLLRHIAKSFKKDREIVMEAVKQNGCALEYANEIFKKDREIVMETLKQNDYAFTRYADASLKKDREFILEAVKYSNYYAINFAHEQLKNDREFVCSLCKQNFSMAKGFSSSLTTEIEQQWNFNVFKKLSISNNPIERFSINFLDENQLYDFIEQGLMFKAKTPKKSTKSNLPITYSSKFVEKLVIFEILKRMNDEEVSNDINYSETANYHLFCFKLDKFLEQADIPPVKMTDLKFYIAKVSQNFKTNHYTKKEIKEIMLFADKWLFSLQNFDNYKQILSKYNQLPGNLSKVFNTLNYLKNEYDFISILGYRGEGVVLKVYHKESEYIRVLKLNNDQEQSEELTSKTINLLKNNEIEGKMPCLDCGIIQNHLFLVMEIGESLSNYILMNSQIGVYKQFMPNEKLEEIIEIFIKVLISVQSIHDHNIVHRDLDPNTIVKVKDDYKIIGLENSRLVKTLEKYSYMSPEIYYSKYDEKQHHNIGNIATSSDLFSLGCIFLKLLTNRSLKLDETFVNDTDFSKYNDNYLYFTLYGKHFCEFLNTIEGELKLHHAIEKLINKLIDHNLGVNNLLIRTIITMIQRDSTKRMDCNSHKVILGNVLKYLRGEIQDVTLNISNQINGLKEITPLRTYSQLANDNMNLLERIKMLELELSKFKQ